MNTLQAILEDHPLLQSQTAQALKHSYLQCDSLLKQEATIDAELSGTTAVVTVMLDVRAVCVCVSLPRRGSGPSREWQRWSLVHAPSLHHCWAGRLLLSPPV